MPKWLDSPIVNKVIRRTVSILDPRYHRIIIIILGVVLFLQWFNVGYTYFDFLKVDKKVALIKENPDESGKDQSNQPPTPRNLAPQDNIFKRTTIPYQLIAIFDNSAIIDGQTVAAGDRIQKATVAEINMDNVVLDMGGGVTRTIEIFSDANMQPMPEQNAMNGLGQMEGRNNRPSGRPGPRRRNMRMQQNSNPPVMIQQPPNIQGLPANIPPEVLEKIRMQQNSQGNKAVIIQENIGEVSQ